MWWNQAIFGLDAYHVMLWFIVYSFIGWAVESTYMSICNRKLTNRGFVKGPFCPIYGAGALTVFFILRPYSNHGVVLFIMGSILATTLEFLTAVVMYKVFGEIWWDYKEKPFNFKGVICLESSVAWGFYTVFLFMFLHNFVMKVVLSVPIPIGRFVGSAIMVLYTVDFLTALYRTKRDTLPEQFSNIKNALLNRIRW